VLFPITESNTNPKQGLNSVVHDRLRRFKQGKIRELYKEAHQVHSKTPKQQAENPVSIQKSAQLAADVDNYKTANARITKHAPVALINQDNLHVLQALHPPSLQRGCIKARTNTRSGGTRRKFRVTPSQVIKTLTHLNKGKATGINCDSLDLYINAAPHINLSNPKDF
jgi:hypothetical protein